MAKILSKLHSKDFTNERCVLVEEMTASNEEIDSLGTIQTNCV